MKTILRRVRTTFLVGDSVEHLGETNCPLLRYQLRPVVCRGPESAINKGKVNEVITTFDRVHLFYEQKSGMHSSKNA